MQPDKHKYLRKGNHIFQLKDDGTGYDLKESFASTNIAKKASRLLQIEEGHGLGRGLLRDSGLVRRVAEVKARLRRV